MDRQRNIYWGIFLTALATLSWEVILTRIFSATMYYHFVFISISLAMLGFGCSGVLVFLLPDFFSKERCSQHLALFSALFAATIFVAILAMLQIHLTLAANLATFLGLAQVLFLIFLPYFFSGITITLALKHYSRNVNLLYCCDLVGAGTGCAAIVALLFVYDGLSLVLLIALLASVASIIFAHASGTAALTRAAYALAALFLILFICNAYVYRFLKIQYMRGVPEKGIIFEEWNPVNRVTVTPGNLDGHKILNIKYDATANALMHEFAGDPEAVSYLKKFTSCFYYQAKTGGDVLIIGVGGGQDVLNAYVSGQKSITGIEINPTIARLNTDTFSDFNGQLFHRPGVRLIVDEGRNYVRHSRDAYDLIHLPNVDSGVASSSGAFTFVENTLYTVEAFKDYYRHLKDDGVLWLSRWRSHKDYFLEDFRVLTGVLRALEDLGVAQPERNIVIMEEKYKPMWRQAIFLMKKTPFQPNEIAALETLRMQLNLDWVHHPQQRLPNILDEYIFSQDREQYLADYPFRVDPNTDDCPFFFNFLKPLHYVWKLPEVSTHFTYPVFMFKSLFVIVFIMIVVAIVLPMLVLRRRLAAAEACPYRTGYIVYFLSLGLGFMLVEIPFIQKFILFLGQPLYAIAVVLSALLIFSGIGSLLGGACSPRGIVASLRTALLLICSLLLVYVLALPAIFDYFLGMPVVLRLGITLLLIMPLGILLGLALPMGIRLLDQDSPAMIPWMWAINGATSVMGSIIAWGLSLNFGYNATMLTAVFVYGCAFLVIVLKPRSLSPGPVVE